MYQENENASLEGNGINKEVSPFSMGGHRKNQVNPIIEELKKIAEGKKSDGDFLASGEPVDGLKADTGDLPEDSTQKVGPDATPGDETSENADTAETTTTTKTENLAEPLDHSKGTEKPGDEAAENSPIGENSNAGGPNLDATTAGTTDKTENPTEQFDNPGDKQNTVVETIENSLTGENSISEAEKNEKRLCAKIKKRLIDCIIENKKRKMITWYWIGDDVDIHFKGTYGDNEINRISANIGVGAKTLYKAIQFATKFTNDDLESLLKKDYLSFRLVVESFPIGRVRALEVFESSKSAKEALDKINEIKGKKPVQQTPPKMANDQVEADNASTEAGGNADAPPKTPENHQQSQSTTKTEPDSSSDSNDVPDKPNQPPETDKKSTKAEVEAAVNSILDGVFPGREPLIFKGALNPEIYESFMEIGKHLVNAGTDKIAPRDLGNITIVAIDELLKMLPYMLGGGCTDTAIDHKDASTRLVNAGTKTPKDLCEIVRAAIADLSKALVLMSEGSIPTININHPEGGTWASSSPSAAPQT